MSNRITLQNDVVTAKKFVQIGTDSISAKKRLASALTSYAELNNRFNIKEVESMLNDKILSPSEKVSLKSRWETMESSYIRIYNTLEAEGLLDLEGMDELRIAYSNLASMLQNVFADMNSSSSAPEGLQPAIEEFNMRFNFISQTYSALAYKIQSYSLRLETSDYFLEWGKPATITAKLYKGADEYKGEEEDNIFSTLSWRGQGLKNAVDTYVSGRTLVVPYEDFEQTFYVSATVNLPIAIL